MSLSPKIQSSQFYPNVYSLVTVLALMCVCQLRAASSLPFYEPFPSSVTPYNGLGYTSGEQLGTTGTGRSVNIWTFGNSISSSSGKVQSAAPLTYPGLTNVDSAFATFGLSSTPADTSSVKDRAAALTVPNNPAAVYASCLLNLQKLTNAATWAFWGLTTNTGGTSVSKNGACVFFDTSGHLLVAKNSGTAGTNLTYALTTNTTYLIVIRYKYNAGGNDQVDLWLDPTSLGDDANIPAANITTTNNSNVGANYFSAVAYFQNALPTLFYLDEIRVATNWSGVTPTTPAPGTIYSVNGGGSGCLGDSFAIGLSGSDLNVTYLLYTNGVASGTTANGTGSAISFTAQSATARYTVLATNNISGNVGWMNGSASVTVLSPPSIVSQPAAAVVATNGLCAFTVGSSGSGLHYQWYRNGAGLVDGGHVSGSQTTNLIISPATPADAATAVNGYYVIVTNQCGASVISGTNALVLDAPANLIWSGDGAANLWDAAVSTNWNTQTAVFNFGDKVIFDDTSANTIITLANAWLSPSSITVNGTQNYAFNGGALVGTGSMLMNSSGTLTLTAPNTTSGGLTISNGIVSFNSATTLGSGPITLAGGTLSSINLSGITVNNPITVTTNSIIRINNTSASALVLNNTLSGNGGTLTFRNNTTSTTAKPTIQLSAAGFTFSQPVFLDVNVGGLILAGNNTAGTQSFSGAISGAGIISRNGSGGTTLLTSSNSYSGGTTLGNGALGIGFDSVSSSPPTVDYGALGTGTLSIDTSATTPTLFAAGSAHSVDNPVVYSSATIGAPLIINGTNSLNFNGTVDLQGDRTIQVDNTGATVFNGVISDGGVTKTGNGALYFNANNIYTDPTIINNGTFGGTGVISGPVSINLGATLAVGASLGTFTINSDLNLAGNLAIKVNKSLSPSNDVVVVSGVLTNSGSGILTVSNLGPALAVGDSFTLFSESVSNGLALTITGGGATWQNNLAVDGSIRVAALSNPIAAYSTNITASVIGSTLQIGWPVTHLGWILQSQTNTLASGLKNNWADIPGSSNVTATNIIINPANPTVFFRLRHP